MLDCTRYYTVLMDSLRNINANLCGIQRTQQEVHLSYSTFPFLCFRIIAFNMRSLYKIWPILLYDGDITYLFVLTTFTILGTSSASCNTSHIFAMSVLHSRHWHLRHKGNRLRMLSNAHNVINRSFLLFSQPVWGSKRGQWWTSEEVV